MAGGNRERGKRFEREARDALRRTWRMEGCVRSAQVDGRYGADLHGTGRLHIEAKVRRSLSVMEFLEQAVRDIGSQGSGKIPVVVMKEDKGPILVMLRMDDTPEFAREILRSIEGAKPCTH